ncbi:MAG: type I DNA topoisomerase [Holosporales bacterium]|jgi:DNA topoisomerase-1|nr:type I DNA topoisomerase [Holosporales bacterium]
MKLVIVESPAKAKTINKYLGSDYKVIASYGHVRDLPSKDGSVDPTNGFSMTWEISDRSKRYVDAIVKESKNADEVLLATDPDREGEAISWHVKDIISSKGIKNKPIRRITFHEITKSAISKAIESPRELDSSLIEAYLARRALDYLVGFTISPVLWRKLPGSRSAGRVQSVALRLIADRELEIEAFKPQEFWTLEALFKNKDGEVFPAKLTVLNGEKLDKFSLNNAELAESAESAVKNCQYKVEKVEKKSIKRNPWPPFITSTLQQEASRKLGFSAKQTMRLAQSLYEGVNIDGETVGLITYMRTDSVNLAGDAVSGIRDVINKNFGEKYLPKSPKIFQNKVKNAQEAHEAVRPTNVALLPSQLQNNLDRDLWRLYELIWKRTVACQMQQALIDQVIVDISDARNNHVFRAVGSTIAFDGFLKLYQEEKDDDKKEDEEDALLPPLSANERVALEDLDKKQHFTQSPPRYTEAGLVKRLEELGIGRPSTYANIIQVLQDRSYVRLDKKRFFPEERGMIVNAFLLNYFTKYVEYDFTADLEQRLDDISNARISRLKVLEDFWQGFIKIVDASKELRVSEILDFVERKLSNHLFPIKEGESAEKTRECPTCGEGRINLKLGRYGAFLGCSLYPKCSFTRALYDASKSSGEENKETAPYDKYEPKLLGKDQKTNEDITLRKGPYGFYVQLGEAKAKKNLKRVAVPKGMDPEQISLSQANILISQPKIVGKHPDDGKEISTGVGRFGPYIKCDNKYFSLDYTQLFSLYSIDQAVAIMSEVIKKPKLKNNKR